MMEKQKNMNINERSPVAMDARTPPHAQHDSVKHQEARAHGTWNPAVDYQSSEEQRESHAHSHTHTHTRTHTHTHTHTHAHTRIHTHTHTHTYTHTHTRTHMHTYTHTRIHTHTHAHTQVRQSTGGFLGCSKTSYFLKRCPLVFLDKKKRIFNLVFSFFFEPPKINHAG